MGSSDMCSAVTFYFRFLHRAELAAIVDLSFAPPPPIPRPPPPGAGGMGEGGGVGWGMQNQFRFRLHPEVRMILFCKIRRPKS